MTAELLKCNSLDWSMVFNAFEIPWFLMSLIMRVLLVKIILLIVASEFCPGQKSLCTPKNLRSVTLTPENF